MTREEMIRALDRTEADLRGLEHRLFNLRAALRDQIDPNHQRKDLGFWPDEEGAELLQPKVGR